MYVEILYVYLFRAVINVENFYIHNWIFQVFSLQNQFIIFNCFKVDYYITYLSFNIIHPKNLNFQIKDYRFGKRFAFLMYIYLIISKSNANHYESYKQIPSKHFRQLNVSHIVVQRKRKNIVDIALKY